MTRESYPRRAGRAHLGIRFDVPPSTALLSGPALSGSLRRELLDPSARNSAPAYSQAAKPLAGPLGDVEASPITLSPKSKAAKAKLEESQSQEQIIGSDKLREMIAREKELRR